MVCRPQHGPASRCSLELAPCATQMALLSLSSHPPRENWSKFLLLLFFKKNASICCLNPGELCKTRPDLNPEDVTAWSGIGEDKPGF